MNEQVVVARREKNFDVNGMGCLLQGLGLLAPMVLGALLSWAGGLIGLVLFLVLFFAGFAEHKKWVCGNCKNPLASREDTICTACGAQLE